MASAANAHILLGQNAVNIKCAQRWSALPHSTWRSCVSSARPLCLTDSSDAAGYKNGSFYDPDSPSLGAWLERLPINVRIQGLGGPRLQQNSTNRVPGFITQGPMPAPDLGTFRASVRKPQPSVKLTHRYQLMQQAPRVCIIVPLRL